MKAVFDKLLHFFIMPCRRIPELLERKNARSLSVCGRVRLRLHLSVCEFCAAYARKAALINRLLEKKYAKSGGSECFEEAETRAIKDRIRKKIIS